MQNILKFMHNCRSFGPDKLIYVTFKCDLDLKSTKRNVSNNTSPPHGKQLCQTILIFMHKYRTYDLDKSGGLYTRTHVHTHAHTP